MDVYFRVSNLKLNDDIPFRPLKVTHTLSDRPPFTTYLLPRMMLRTGNVSGLIRVSRHSRWQVIGASVYVAQKGHPELALTWISDMFLGLSPSPFKTAAEQHRWVGVVERYKSELG